MPSQRGMAINVQKYKYLCEDFAIIYIHKDAALPHL